jgi:hypothetical protein
VSQDTGSWSRHSEQGRRDSTCEATGLSSDAPSSRSYVDDSGAVVIGRLRVGPAVLGYGSAGERAHCHMLGVVRI